VLRLLSKSPVCKSKRWPEPNLLGVSYGSLFPNDADFKQWLPRSWNRCERESYTPEGTIFNHTYEKETSSSRFGLAMLSHIPKFQIYASDRTQNITCSKGFFILFRRLGVEN